MMAALTDDPADLTQRVGRFKFRSLAGSLAAAGGAGGPIRVLGPAQDRRAAVTGGGPSRGGRGFRRIPGDRDSFGVSRFKLPGPATSSSRR